MLEKVSDHHLVQSPCPSRDRADRTGPCFGYFKDEDSATSLGNAAVLSDPHSKPCFMMLRANIPCFSLCPSPLLSQGIDEKKALAQLSLHPPPQVFTYTDEMMKPLSLLISCLDSHSAFPHRRDSPVLHLYNRLATEDSFLLL